MTGNIIVKEERITPKLARQILDANNTGNRPVSPGRVSQYARDMMAGRWMSTGDTIKFAAGGRLLDGQHRLRAVVEANKPIDFMVARGVASSVFTAIDTGKSRTGTDVLAIEGMEPELARTVSTAARMCYGYDTGTPTHKPGDHRRLDNQGVLDYVTKYPGIVDAAKFVHDNWKNTSLLSRAQLTWALFEARRSKKADSDAADLFILDLLEGSMLSREDPVFRLREALIDERTSTRKSGTESVLGALVKAWNKRVEGKRITGPNRLLTRDWGAKFPRFA